MKKGRLKYACPPEAVLFQDQPVKAPQPSSLSCRPLPPSVDQPLILYTSKVQPQPSSQNAQSADGDGDGGGAVGEGLGDAVLTVVLEPAQ